MYIHVLVYSLLIDLCNACQGVCMYVCIYIYICTRICSFIYIYVYIYIHIHMRIYVYVPFLPGPQSKLMAWIALVVAAVEVVAVAAK